ncbi:MAG: HAMP domain-containing protein [Myxococcales bacterium]|nr:HAMP domain-containing protein [Myxococcales bacterium]
MATAPSSWIGRRSCNLPPVRPRFPLYYKLTATSFLVVLMVLGFVAVIDYRDQRRALEEKFGLTLQHVAQTAALFVDGAAHDRVRGQGDAPGGDFARLREVLDRVRRENGLREDQIYTLRPVGGGALEFVVMLQAKTFIADRYTPPPRVRPLLEKVLGDGTPRYTPIYRDENGAFISAYAPVRDAAGKIVAVLEVDYDVARFLAELEADLRERVWIVPAALGLALVLSLLVARSINRSVRQLVDGTTAISAGQYEHVVVVRTRDELHILANAFNEMTRGLRERFAMLKFVPKHTRDAIADAARNASGIHRSLAPQRREVAVLFSDIRGFTALSDKLPADRVIEMLNIYLRKEAQLVEAHGGTVDKFIGDGMMAVFDGPERSEDAVRASLAIQEAARELNEQQAFEQSIELGIGVACGEVTMGNVGYETRMEFAVIGRFVNLASRLCSQAAPREVLASEAVWSALGGRYGGEALRRIKLKGFGEEVTCWRVTRAAADAG